METGEKVIIALVVLVTVGVLIGVVFGAVVLMPKMMEEMEKPESCASNCHEMEYFVISHQESVHSDIDDCHDCHHPHGLEMFMYMGHATHHAETMVEAMMEGRDTKEAFAEMAHHIEEKPPASPKNEHCTECHEERNVDMPEYITESDISCIRCHDGTGAAPAVAHGAHNVSDYMGYESPGYAGYECVACHNDHDIGVKEETCTTCHPPKKTH